jgi:hypothetical protein
MFVRWKSRQLTRTESGAPERSLYAVLVECKRIDGQPRQKVIKYLGHINEEHLGIPRECREFWDQAKQSLDTVDFEPGVRRRLEAKMAEVVPKRRRSTPIKMTGSRTGQDVRTGISRRKTAAHAAV